MKSPRNLKPIERNPALLAAFKIRKHKDQNHCVTLYVQSADAYGGKLRIIVYPRRKHYGREIRLDAPPVETKNGFTDFCDEVSSIESYESLMEVLERHGFDTAKAETGFGIRMKRGKNAGKVDDDSSSVRGEMAGKKKL